ncbi:hypothetical protein D918_08707 [Trichuris suis]|nr:hypothetical protein D918_08707 [Trichuris suis]
MAKSLIYVLPYLLLQYSIAKRSQEIRRAVSSLSYPPNLKVRKNFFPSLLQDAAASCFWKENNGRLVPESVMNDLGVPLLAHICTSASQCKNQCLEMHEDSDIEVCNYITWYEQSNTALFYSLEPTKHWHLQSVPNVKSYEWRCILQSLLHGKQWNRRIRSYVPRSGAAVRRKILRAFGQKGFVRNALRRRKRKDQLFADVLVNDNVPLTL